MEIHMKLKLATLLLTTLITVPQLVMAGGYGHNRGYNYNYNRVYNNNWIAPAIIGGAIVGGLVYGATRPAPVYVQPPVYYTPPVYVQPQVPYGYHYENIFDGNCNCYRQVLVPN